MSKTADNTADVSEAAPAELTPPADIPVVPRVRPWANLCKLTPALYGGFYVYWCGKKHELKAEQSFWLHPATKTWGEKKPEIWFENHMLAYDAACVSPQPPGWK